METDCLPNEIPAVAIDVLLENKQALLGRIKLAFGSDREAFDETLALIQRYAAFVHWLPATANSYFPNPGGLLQLGLEVGLYSLQGSEAHIFSGRSTILVRRHLEPRWRLATFIAGLCAELHRALSHISVHNPAGDRWPSYRMGLFDWLHQSQATRYTLSWNRAAIESRALALFALPHVVGTSMLEYLADANDVVVPHLLSSVSGQPLPHERPVLPGLVRRALALVIDQNLQAQEREGQTVHNPDHWPQFLIDVLRQLATANASWVPNTPLSRIWFAEDGAYLIWPTAANDLAEYWSEQRLSGMPVTPISILNTLHQGGILQANAEGPIWTIHLPDRAQALLALKLSDPGYLWDIDHWPTPVPFRLSSDDAPEADTGGTSPLPETEDPETHTIAPSSTADEKPPATRVRANLKAFLRLSASLHLHIQQLVQDHEGQPFCRCLEHGLFIALPILAPNGMTTQTAIRELADAQMLVKRAHDLLHTENFDDKTVHGVIVARGCIESLPGETPC